MIPRLGSNQRPLAPIAKYVLSTALALYLSEATGGEASELHQQLVTGIEPATFGTEIRRSNHCEAFLSYGTHSLLIRWDATGARRLLD